MRIFNKSLAVAACVAAVTFGAVAPPAHAGVTFYSDANFLGSRIELPPVSWTTKLKSKKREAFHV